MKNTELFNTLIIMNTAILSKYAIKRRNIAYIQYPAMIIKTTTFKINL